MSHQDYSNIKFQKIPNNSINIGSNEPIYIPDWDDLAERSLIMAHYWQHVHELAKLQLALDRIGGMDE